MKEFCWRGNTLGRGICLGQGEQHATKIHILKKNNRNPKICQECRIVKCWVGDTEIGLLGLNIGIHTCFWVMEIASACEWNDVHTVKQNHQPINHKTLSSYLNRFCKETGYPLDTNSMGKKTPLAPWHLFSCESPVRAPNARLFGKLL